MHRTDHPSRRRPARTRAAVGVLAAFAILVSVGLAAGAVAAPAGSALAGPAGSTPVGPADAVGATQPPGAAQPPGATQPPEATRSPGAAQDDPGIELEATDVTVAGGGIATLDVAVSDDYGGDDGEFGLVVSAPGSEGGYALNASVPTNATAIHLNTYAAGHSHRANVSAADVVWAIDADGDELSASLENETALEGRLAAGVEYEVRLGEDVAAAHRAPDAVGSLVVEERDPAAASMRVLRAPANASLDTPAGIARAEANGSLTGTDVVVPDRSEQLVLRVAVPGQAGLYRTVDGPNATARLRSLLADGSAALRISQSDATADAGRRVIDVANSRGAIDAVEDRSNGTVSVVVDLAAADVDRADGTEDASLGTGHAYEASYVLADAHLVGANGSTPRSGPADDPVRHERVAVAFETAGEDSAFLDEPVILPPERNASVVGETNLAPGTTATVVLESGAAEAEYRRTDRVAVGTDGRFSATLDLRNATAGDAFTLATRGGIDASADGEVLHGGAARFAAAASAPANVTAGEEATLEVVVENLGSANGSANYTVRVDGVAVEDGTLAVAAGGRATVAHALEAVRPGDLEWAVELEGTVEEHGTLTVAPALDGPITPEEPVRAGSGGDGTTGDAAGPGDADGSGDGEPDRVGRSRFGLIVAVAILVLGGVGSILWLASDDL